MSGHLVTPEIGRLVEIKTKRTTSKGLPVKIDWCAWYLQMLFGGMEILIVGLHDKGYVVEVHELTLEQVRNKMDPGMVESIMTRLELLLEQILALSNATGCPLDLFCQGSGNAPLVAKRRAANA